MSIEVSIIIPIFNEERYISKCLESIVSQDFPIENLEILLVDGKSTDNTKKIIESYMQNYPVIRILCNPDRITPKSMNIGIKAAKGKFIIVTSAHAKLMHNYVSKCIETFNSIDADNVGGNIITQPGKSALIAEAISFATSNIFGVGNSKFRISNKAGYVDTVAFGAFKKKVFNKIGLFNERLIRNQDIEFNSRIIKNDGKIYLNPEIKSYYYNRSNVHELCKQNFQNGRWNIYTMLLSPGSLSVRHFVPFLFLFSLLFASFVSCFLMVGKIVLISVLISYFSLSIIFSFKIGIKNNLKLIPILPLVFFLLHISYGLGSFWGFLTIKKLL